MELTQEQHNKRNKFMLNYCEKSKELLETQRRLTEAQCLAQNLEREVGNKTNDLYYLIRDNIGKPIEELTNE